MYKHYRDDRPYLIKPYIGHEDERWFPGGFFEEKNIPDEIKEELYRDTRSSPNIDCLACNIL